MQKAQNRLMRFDLEPPSAPPSGQHRRKSGRQTEWKIKKSAAGADLAAVFVHGLECPRKRFKSLCMTSGRFTPKTIGSFLGRLKTPANSLYEDAKIIDCNGK